MITINISREEAEKILNQHNFDLLDIWESGFQNNYNSEGIVEEEFSTWNAETITEMEEILLDNTWYQKIEDETEKIIGICGHNEIHGFAYGEILFS